MIQVATWASEEHFTKFAQALAFAPDIRLVNARTEPIDMERADGLLLAGGADVDAGSLNQPVPTPSPIEETDPARDAWDLPAARKAFERGIPILGVCRGHQVLNVALGGTLVLHVDGHQLGEKGEGAHGARCAAGLSAWRRYERINSTHHQAVDRPADGFEIEAWSIPDRVVEQIWHRSHPWCLGVQYHPERGPNVYGPLFQEFVRVLRG